MAVQWPLLLFSVLLGISAGAMVFVGIGELAAKFKGQRFAGAAIAFVLLALGGCASVFHLGHPERALHILGNLGSGLSKELFAVGAMAVVTFVYAILAKKNFAGAAKVAGVIGLVVALILPFVAGASYMMAARPAWDSLALPVMYLGTGIGMGFLLMAALVCLKPDSGVDAGLAATLAVTGSIVSALTEIAYVAWVAMAPWQAASRSIDRLVSGDMAAAFWIGVVALGIVASIALAVVARKKAGDAKAASGLLFASFACSVVGSVVLRIAMYGLGTSIEHFIY